MFMFMIILINMVKNIGEKKKKIQMQILFILIVQMRGTCPFRGESHAKVPFLKKKIPFLICRGNTIRYILMNL